MKTDLVLELLSRINPLHGAFVEDLCADLGILRSGLPALITQARDRGFMVSTHNGTEKKSGRVVSMDRGARDKIMAAATDYVDRQECGL
jgi:hypothetical protein